MLRVLKGHMEFLETNWISTKCHQWHVQSILLCRLGGTQEVPESVKQEGAAVPSPALWALWQGLS